MSENTDKLSKENTGEGIGMESEKGEVNMPQRVADLEAKLQKILKDAKESLEVNRDTRALTFFGFFALVIVVIGIAFGYWQFISMANQNNTNVNDQLIKNTYDISGIKKDLNNLKICLKSGGWNSCLIEN